jgi:activator of 2-hydroxyglutaryl-CoA dehydratase
MIYHDFKEKTMIKKLMIEKSDRNKINKWDNKRLGNFYERVSEIYNETDQEYIIGLDIASKDSTDKSVMVKFRLVDDNYIFEGYEMI